MPRGRCHFALLHDLHERLRVCHPEAADLADRHLPDFVAGSAGPDGLRFLGRRGKFATHYYTEDRRETWGKAVQGLFGVNQDIADPGQLQDADIALVMGYISHLTVDEAFRDIVTSQLHGQQGWRPVVKGFWSLVDELPVGYTRLADELARFSRTGCVGPIDRAILGQYLDRIRDWAIWSESWQVELLFLELTQNALPLEAARKEWGSNRQRAMGFLDERRMRRFVDRASELGTREVIRFLDGDYCAGS